MYEELKLDNELCFRIYTASRLITQAYRPLLDPLGLTYPQYLVMLVLWERDNMTVNEIGKRLVLDSNTLTPLLKRMEADGLIVRSRGIVDGRQTLVTLTKKGRHLEAQATEIPKCLANSWQDKPLNPKDVAAFVNMLDKMIDTLKSND